MSKKLLKWSRWELVGNLPDLKKYLVIIAPHTSNWDFLIFVLVKFSYGFKINFFAKHTLFKGGVGWFVRKIGGVPVVRHKSSNLVDDIVEAFGQNDELVLGIAPEGTRSYKDHWKSGFYHIALKAKLPIQTAFLDKKTRTVGFGPLFNLTGELERDIEMIKSFYADKMGLRPELFSKIAFRSRN